MPEQGETRINKNGERETWLYRKLSGVPKDDWYTDEEISGLPPAAFDSREDAQAFRIKYFEPNSSEVAQNEDGTFSVFVSSSTASSRGPAGAPGPGGEAGWSRADAAAEAAAEAASPEPASLEEYYELITGEKWGNGPRKWVKVAGLQGERLEDAGPDTATIMDWIASFRDYQKAQAQAKLPEEGTRIVPYPEEPGYYVREDLKGNPLGNPFKLPGEPLKDTETIEPYPGAEGYFVRIDNATGTTIGYPFQLPQDEGPTTYGEPEFRTDPATGQRYYRSGDTDQWTPVQAPAKPTLDNLIMEALVEGTPESIQAAIDLDDFARRPSQMERLNAALQVAQSPSDYLTVVGMLRGELPAQQQGLGKIGPAPESNKMFGLGGQGGMEQGLGQAGQGFLAGRQQGQQQQQTGLGQMGQTFQQQGLAGVENALRQLQQQGIPHETLEPIHQQYLAAQNRIGPVPAEAPIYAVTNVPQSGMMPIGADQFRLYNHQTNQFMAVDKQGLSASEMQARLGEAWGAQGSPWSVHQTGGSEPMGVTGLAGEWRDPAKPPTTLRLGATGQPALGATTSLATTGRQGLGQPVQYTNLARTGQQGATEYPSYMQQALGSNLLGRGAETPRLGYQSLVKGLPPMRSLQTQQMQTPTERQFSETIPTLFGIPREDYLEQEWKTASIGGPRRQRARFIGATR